jgi:hypothetical protein
MYVFGILLRCGNAALFPMVYVISVAPAASVWQHFGAKIACGEYGVISGW